MAYPEAKVYFDGSHYVAIPHTTRRQKPRRTPIETTVAVTDDLQPTRETTSDESIFDYIRMGFIPVEVDEKIFDDDEPSPSENEAEKGEKTSQSTRKLTRKQVFNEWYEKTSHLKYKERFTAICEKMRP